VKQAQALAATQASWWSQFPAPLRRVAMVRLVGSIGAGGVLYLTPLVFHRADFSASNVNLGVALAAVTGTIGRFVSGGLLDRGCRCSLPVLLAVACALAGDLQLGLAGTMAAYGRGQLLLGLAMGLYWPAIELAVSLTAGSVGSPRGYALARTTDAVGIAAGALLGALLAALGPIRAVYAVDLGCLILMAWLLLRAPFPAAERPWADQSQPPPLALGPWLRPLLPILLVSLVATAVPALMQSALPLDLVRGSLRRPPMNEALGALLVGSQLVLLLLIQWPVGRWLADRPVQVGLRLSLLCFSGGALLLGCSGFSAAAGPVLVWIAQLPLAIGLAAFLPTATEAVVELSPPARQGLAMALFSQCFAVSAFVAPLIAGRLLEGQGHGAGVWFSLAVATALSLMPVRWIERLQRRRLLAVLTGSGDGAQDDQDQQASTPEVLYRFGPSDGEA
jgi:MFS family permease